MNPLRFLRKRFVVLFLTPTILLVTLTTIGNLSSKAETLEVKAKKASAFIDSIGVMIGLYPKYDSFWTYIHKPLLQNLGVRHVRFDLRMPVTSIAPGSQGRIVADRVNELGKLKPPIKSLGIMRSDGTWGSRMRALEYMLGNLEAVEGHNEPDGAGENFSYVDKKGVLHGFLREKSVGKGWSYGLQLFTQDLYSYIKGRSNPLFGLRNKTINSRLSKIQILSPAVVYLGWYRKDSWDLEKYIDYGNLHVYSDSSQNPEGYIKEFITARAKKFSSKPVFVTEMGYSTPPKGYFPPVPNEEIQARYNVRHFFELFRFGIKRSYLYNFLDLWGAKNYSLVFCSDPAKPNCKPTIAYKAIQSMITILQNGSGQSDFPVKSLRYQMRGDLSNVRKDVVLQKSDGRVYLILWLGVPYDAASLKRVLTLKIETPGFSKAQIYTPVTNGTKIVQIITNPYIAQPINVPDHPLILELIPKSFRKQ